MPNKPTKRSRKADIGAAPADPAITVEPEPSRESLQPAEVGTEDVRPHRRGRARRDRERANVIDVP